MEPATAHRESAVRLLIRFALAVVGIFFLWLMARRLGLVHDAYAQTFEFSATGWVLAMVLGAAGGFSFGLAAVLPVRFRGYRWGRALVIGILPLALVAVFGMWLFSFQAGGVESIPFARVLLWVMQLFGGNVDQWAAVLLGVALASGFGGPEAAVPPAEGSPTERTGSPA